MCGIICLIKFNDKIDQLEAVSCCQKLLKRGPDRYNYEIFKIDCGEIFMGFTRLAIMDTSDAGLQPFTNDHSSIICNGEIYNYIELAQHHQIETKTSCDCEVLLPLAEKVGFKQMVQTELDGEFATVYYDQKNSIVYAARDRYGVRPLYYGYNNRTKTIGFASELKALHPIMDVVYQVKPNQILSVKLVQDDLDNVVSMDDLICATEYFDYNKLVTDKLNYMTDVELVQNLVRDRFTQAVKKRLCADRPIGFLLSGGLDSSLVVAIATKILGPEKIVCFSVGMEGSPDIEASKKVVQYLGIKQHHIIPFTVQKGLDSLTDVIRTIETYDITTIRASTPQYIMAKYINENTDIKVILSGEGSDEIHGSYKYMRFAPTEDEFHDETIRLLSELYYFDNLRTDRTMAGYGLEVRVPFLDHEYVKLVANIHPKLLMYREDYIEKKIIRDSFKGLLPEEILYRPKEAFSDAVSSNDVNWYKSVAKLADTMISNEELYTNPYKMNVPKSKESLLYRRIFNSIYPNRDTILPHFWLPTFPRGNNITDPSATVL